jgi:hypothetical protein
MDLTGVVRVINFVIRALFIVLGILLIAGVFGLRNISSQFRILFGVVFILYGAFRLATLFMSKGPGDRE